MQKSAEAIFDNLHHKLVTTVVSLVIDNALTFGVSHEIRTRSPPMAVPNAGRVCKIQSHALYQMVILVITLVDT